MSVRKKSGKEVSIVRSSAAEYLTFIAASGTGGIDAVYADENIWLTQKMMGALYDVVAPSLPTSILKSSCKIVVAGRLAKSEITGH
jgi:hypothetical protein